jgi:hypothetical protein
MAYWHSRTVPVGFRVVTQAAGSLPLEGCYHKPGGGPMRLSAELTRRGSRRREVATFVFRAPDPAWLRSVLGLH